MPRFWWQERSRVHLGQEYFDPQAAEPLKTLKVQSNCRGVILEGVKGLSQEMLEFFAN